MRNTEAAHFQILESLWIANELTYGLTMTTSEKKSEKSVAQVEWHLLGEKKKMRTVDVEASAPLTGVSHESWR